MLVDENNPPDDTIICDFSDGLEIRAKNPLQDCQKSFTYSQARMVLFNIFTQDFESINISQNKGKLRNGNTAAIFPPCVTIVSPRWFNKFKKYNRISCLTYEFIDGSRLYYSWSNRNGHVFITHS